MVVQIYQSTASWCHQYLAATWRGGLCLALGSSLCGKLLASRRRGLAWESLAVDQSAKEEQPSTSSASAAGAETDKEMERSGAHERG